MTLSRSFDDSQWVTRVSYMKTLTEKSDPYTADKSNETMLTAEVYGSDLSHPGITPLC